MSVSLCTVSGTILDTGGNPVVGAVVRWTATVPVLDASNNLLTPTEVQTTTGYTFTITSASATAGAIYSSADGQLFTVLNTIVSGVSILMSTPQADTSLAASGTLTKQSGTGAATLTYSAFQGGTWQLPIVQSTSGSFVINYPPNGSESQLTFYFPAVIPATSTAAFSSVWTQES